VVDACYADMDIVGMGENDPGVVFGGAGEPLLRLDTIAVRAQDFSHFTSSRLFLPTSVLSGYFYATSVLSGSFQTPLQWRPPRPSNNHHSNIDDEATPPRHEATRPPRYDDTTRRTALYPAAVVEEVRASRHGVPFRVSTNGLFPAAAAAALADINVQKVTAGLHSLPGVSDWLHVRPELDLWVDTTQGCTAQGCTHSRGCKIGYMEHTGCHQLMPNFNRVLTHNNNVE
jgi:hypothetical protein